jgi:hypothetical protein
LKQEYSIDQKTFETRNHITERRSSTKHQKPTPKDLNTTTTITAAMYFDTLPTEILTQIYLSLPSIDSALALSSTCHHFRHVYRSSKRLLILMQAAESEFGPLNDIIQILTQNPSHIRREVPISDALIKQIVSTGRVAQKYEEIYPFKKWKTDFASRRLLTSAERYNFRRALYRLWLFDSAFHNPGHVRFARSLPETMRERAALLHNFHSEELAEMLDVHSILRDVVANNVCPSNGRIRQKFHKRYPDSTHQLLFNIHLNYPPSSFVPDSGYYNSNLTSSKYHAKLSPSRFHEPGAEGWGDDIGHYYVVEDMMKLDPGQILLLKEQFPLKSQVEAYVAALGEYFVNNGETFSETVGFVIRQRGGDMAELKAAVEEGEAGVVRLED